MATVNQFVTLGVGEDVFALPIESVREILEMRRIARLPHAPNCVLGMIDVRGESVPVLDLRLRLGLEPVPETAATRIVILNAEQDGSELSVGLLAERVFEVAELDDGRLDPPPAVGGAKASACVSGVGRRRDAFVMVFDVPRLLRLDDLPSLATKAA
ncbi:chemotaxis protein CheW [Alsobacter metallidurans]|uniref:Chemotaxis protein CheW n=1 Tax=Alsobacter metallidurans TaxID=340221 RepID=A0A917MIJ9_9HYPH|nr:chemotaxis protein CheW [Alsobacter metallidurans]GGH23894.1 chemotaxis protein CheW [Alsobacter metallidurans]